MLFFSLFFFLSFLFLFCFEILEKCRETGGRKPKPRGIPPKMRWFSKEPSDPVQWTSPVFLKLLCPPLVEFPMPACSGRAGGAEPPPHLPDAWLRHRAGLGSSSGSCPGQGLHTGPAWFRSADQPCGLELQLIVRHHVGAGVGLSFPSFLYRELWIEHTPERVLRQVHSFSLPSC